MIPFAASPARSLPVTRLTASGLQYVRTSLKICAVFVNRCPSSIAAPFRLSFSVATICGRRIPFQSKLEQSIASIKSPLGMKSVH
jgi:hypothetical protein